MRRTCGPIGTALTGVAVVPIATDVATHSRVAPWTTIGKSSGARRARSAAPLLIQARNDAAPTNGAARQLREDGIGDIVRHLDESVVLANVDFPDLGARYVGLVR